MLGRSQSFLGLFNANLEVGGAREEPAESNLRRAGHCFSVENAPHAQAGRKLWLRPAPQMLLRAHSTIALNNRQTSPAIAPHSELASEARAAGLGDTQCTRRATWRRGPGGNALRFPHPPSTSPCVALAKVCCACSLNFLLWATALRGQIVSLEATNHQFPGSLYPELPPGTCAAAAVSANFVSSSQKKYRSLALAVFPLLLEKSELQTVVCAQLYMENEITKRWVILLGV